MPYGPPPLYGIFWAHIFCKYGGWGWSELFSFCKPLVIAMAQGLPLLSEPERCAMSSEVQRDKEFRKDDRELRCRGGTPALPSLPAKACTLNSTPPPPSPRVTLLEVTLVHWRSSLCPVHLSETRESTPARHIQGKNMNKNPDKIWPQMLQNKANSTGLRPYFCSYFAL